MARLVSSAISEVDYGPGSKTLSVRFTGGRSYDYYDVPLWKYQGLLNAASVGQYFNDNIRDQHSSNR